METAIAKALLFGEREARIFAAREIGKLNCNERQKLAENGAIPPLIFMLESQDYESIEAALLALLNLAFGSERNKIRIAKSGATQALLKALQWRNESLLELALAALLILSSCAANKPEIASSGAVQLLFELLDSESPNGEAIGHQAKLDIISTLHNLSTSPETLPSAILSDGLIRLIQLICDADKSSDLAEKAVALLESLVSSSESAVSRVAEIGGAIGLLVEAVEEGTASCKEHAAAILAVICGSCRERYRGVILGEGAMPGLMQLSVDGNRRAREKAKTLMKMLRESSDSGPARVRHSKSVLFEEVMRKIDRGGRRGGSIQLVEKMIARLKA
ncbi:ARM repeat superfamily protein [Striga asiatica]|uniref:ARM repeat superfamily protein n=1 Tax=Striga asiatica TaxID=4170 RepID=A0A5A7P9U6_STRAF|nr:ARM repeat superfamily protein [Striga asiatica]